MASSLTIPIKLIAVLLLFNLVSVAVVESCPPGTYSSWWNWYCRSCADGYYQEKSDQKECIPCPDGHYCPSKSERPKPCPAGTSSWYFINQRLECVNCSDGFYQDKPGQKSCIQCPDGHKCPMPKTRAIPCSPGTSSSYFIHKRLECANCSDGFYQDKPGQVSCIQCPDGHKCPIPKTRAIPCSPGTSSAYFIHKRLECANCSDGYYQDKPGQVSCIQCPDGHKCPIPKTRAIPCSPGTSSAYFIHKRLECENCSNGYYQDKPGQVSCMACPNRHYCPSKKNRPLLCPSGSTSPGFFSARTSCVKCSPDQCQRPAISPLICPPGTYLYSGLWSAPNCRACSRGQYQAESGQSSCNACPFGFYCPDASKKPIPCPPGTHSYTTSTTACLPCLNGMYQVLEGQASCLACPLGHFCSDPTKPPVQCPVGTFASRVTATKCNPCFKNYYQDNSGQQQCKVCPSGFLCPKADQSPLQCPPNTYRHSFNTNASKCQECPSHQYQDQCGQINCKSTPKDGLFPTKSPSLNCATLNSSYEDCAAVSRYSSAESVEIKGSGNKLYPVVKILPEHRSQTCVYDNHIKVETAIAFSKMACAAKADGVTILIESGFRSLTRQIHLYNCKQNKTLNCATGNKVAEPGKSNHGYGIALDLLTTCGKPYQPKCADSPVYMWLKKHAHNHGFIRNVTTEPWHWEFRGGPLPGPTSYT